jgi:hypothetical protein
MAAAPMADRRWAHGAAADCGEGGGSTVQLRRTGGGEASRGVRARGGAGGLDLGRRIHGAKLRRRTVVRAADPRCSCGGRGQASGGGGGLW